MKARARRHSLVAGALVAILAAGCTGTGTARTDLPPPPPTLRVDMLEYRFDHPPQASPGRTTVRVRNVGGEPHELTVVQLRPDQTGSVQDLVLSLQSMATVVALPESRPGGEAVFALDLVPGRYGLICFTQDAAGTPHVAKGMASSLTVV